MKQRFDDHQLQLLKCIQQFSPKSLRSHSSDYTPSDVESICSLYELDSSALAAELNLVQYMYLQCEDDIDLSDSDSSDSDATDAETETASLMSNSSKHDQTNISDNHKTGVNCQDDSDNDSVSELSQDNSFLVPFRVLSNMAAAYPNLFVLYKILLSLPVTNCSAERAISRLKLVKTRLRSSMSISWLNDLMIMSTERHC